MWWELHTLESSGPLSLPWHDTHHKTSAMLLAVVGLAVAGAVADDADEMAKKMVARMNLTGPRPLSLILLLRHRDVM